MHTPLATNARSLAARRLGVERLEERSLLAAMSLADQWLQAAQAIDIGRARFPAANVVAARSESSGDAPITEVLLVRGAALFEVEVLADGTLLEEAQLVAFTSLPPHVAEAVRTAFPDARFAEAEIIFGDANEVAYEVRIQTPDGRDLDMSLGAAGQVLSLEALPVEREAESPNLLDAPLGFATTTSETNRSATDNRSPTAETSSTAVVEFVDPESTESRLPSEATTLAEVVSAPATPLRDAPEIQPATRAATNDDARVALVDAARNDTHESDTSRDQFFAQLASSLAPLAESLAAALTAPTQLFDFAGFDEQLRELLCDLDSLAAELTQPFAVWRSPVSWLLAAAAGSGLYLLLVRPRDAKLEWDELAHTWAWGLAAKPAEGTA